MTARPLADLACRDDLRLGALRANALNGIDYLEVSEDERVLHVHFVKDVPDGGYGLPADPSPVRIEGGTRIRDVRAEFVVRRGPRQLDIHVSGPGDYSAYTLSIALPGVLDPVYSSVPFSFKAGCPNRFDCRPREEGLPAAPAPTPTVDYLAKDYASFRQALLDLAPTFVPWWSERNEADLGVALVELLAYVADHLSYFQDSVANEAFLSTARQRISLRRHAQLIDYRMHDGASARAFVHFRVRGEGTIPEGTPVLARVDVPLKGRTPPHGPVIPLELEGSAIEATPAPFATMQATPVSVAMNRIPIHAWGNARCCLQRGATRVDLRGDWRFDEILDGPDGVRRQTWRLKAGDFLLLEEEVHPDTGLAQDADRMHRQVVRIQEVALVVDPLPSGGATGAVPLTRVTWSPADALAFPLWVSSVREDGTPIPEVSVARGNVALADHGYTVREWHPGSPSTSGVEGIRVGTKLYRFRLGSGPLSRHVPFDAVVEPGEPPTPASEIAGRGTEAAMPAIRIETHVPRRPVQTWEAVSPHLLDSGRYAYHFVVESDNDGRGVVRFGDGRYGARAPDGAFVFATYRVGLGTAGNVGAESLEHVVGDGSLPQIEGVRNPLPAWGGVNPEPMERVRRLAPSAFRAEQFRAVTAEDYARAAEKVAGVAKAVATFRWTGSWHTVFLTIDPRGGRDVGPDLERKVRDRVSRHAQTGYDLEIDPPAFVPLDIEIEVCAAPDHFRTDVEAELLRAMGSGTRPDGRRGFFHPDNFTFGQPLHLSRLYEAIAGVEGVESAIVTRFERFGKPPAGELAAGLLRPGPLEVLELANDSNFPERGVLRFRMRGGR